MQGNVFDIPPKSLLNKFKIDQTLKKDDSLINFKLSAKTRGLVKIKQNPIDQTINSLKICNCLYLFDTTIYKNKGETILATKHGTKWFQNEAKPINNEGAETAMFCITLAVLEAPSALQVWTLSLIHI